MFFTGFIIACFHCFRSGLHHTVVGLERKLKSTQLDLNESKRTVVKLL